MHQVLNLVHASGMDIAHCFPLARIIHADGFNKVWHGMIKLNVDASVLWSLFLSYIEGSGVCLEMQRECGFSGF